jgi:nucleoside phosphorylase
LLLAQATKKGGHPASALTHDILTEFKPTLVLLIGVAGGFGQRGVKLYDLIVARNIFNYDPERIQHGPGGERPQPYRCDEQLLRLVNYLATRGQLDDVLDGAQLHQKDYASGEKVIAWRDADLRQRLPGLSCDLYGFETEEHGVMHTIWEAFKDEHFVGGSVIKCISDLGDEDMAVDKDAKQTRPRRKHNLTHF